MNGDTKRTVEPGNFRPLGELLTTLRQALGHELPNHLVAARGLARLLELEEGERLGGDGRDYLRRLSGSIEGSHALVEALAEVVRAALDQEAARPVLVAELVQEVATELRHAGVDGAVDFACDILVPAVAAPPRGLRRVLTEVLRQSVRLAAARSLIPAFEGGTSREGPKVAVAARPTAEGVEIRVEDNGGGLSMNEAHQLFEPFGHQDGGSGLGMVLARVLADRWGGSITVTTAAGRGTIFAIWIPGPGSREE
jgi:signal transduction histidine kinase